MFKISDWFKLILCTVLSSGVAFGGNFGQMNFAYWKIPPVASFSATYLVVAGGAGGGGDIGAGGGAGGLLTGSSTLVVGTTYTVTVGLGGSGGGYNNTGSNGNDSLISGSGLTTITSTGGGGGSGLFGGANNGGSGGGGSLLYPSPGTGVSGQGYAGGYQIGGTASGCGGGGGAGQVGGDTDSAGIYPGAGGNGVQSSITGTSTYYAGGGGGGTGELTTSQNNGGLGGGGIGGYSGSPGGNGGFAATFYGGGGGGGGASYPGSGGSGYQGVVIISLPAGYAATTTGTPTVTINGTNTVYTFTVSGTLIPRTGTPNYSNYFNGSTSYLTAGSNTGFNLSTGDWTIEYWCYINAYGSNYTGVIDSRTTAGTYANWCTGINSNTIDLVNVGGAGTRLRGNATIPLNTWTYIAITRSSGTIRCFKNGVLDTSVSYSSSMDAGSSNPVIGKVLDSGGSFSGYISNLRIVIGTALYTSSFTPPTSPLTAVSGTSLLTCQSSTFVDNSSNATSLTNSNVTISLFSPF